MASKKKVEVELIFDSKGAITGIKTAEGELLDLDKAANKNVASMAKLSTAMKVGVAAAALAMAAAARKGFQVLSESVELAGVQQIAERKLEQALRNTGDASEESAEQLKKLASEVQNVSNFGDEAIITAQAMLLSFSEVSGAEGAALLTSRLADVAAGVADANGQTIGLNAAAAALGKALGGGAGALREYGISLSKSQEEQFNTLKGMEKVRLLTEILDSNFKGLAAATADPFVRAQNAVTDLKQALGTELRPEIERTAQTFTQFIQDDQTVGFVTKVGEGILKMGQRVMDFFQFDIPISLNRYRLMSARFNAQVEEQISGLIDRINQLNNILNPLSSGNVLPNPFKDRVDNFKSLAANAHDALVALVLERQELEKNRKAVDDSTDAYNRLNAAKNPGEGENAGPAPSRPGIEVQEKVDIVGDSLFDIPVTLDEVQNSIALATQAMFGFGFAMEDVASDSQGQLIASMLGLGDALDIVNEKTEENEDASKGAQKAFRSYSTGSISNLQDMGRAVQEFMVSFIQAKLNEAIAGSAAREFSTKGLFGAITAGIAAGAVRAFFSQLPGFATGVTGFGGGMALVGERGPELVSLGQGSNVITNENTNKILERLDRTTSVNNSVTVNNTGMEGAIERLGESIKNMQIQIDYFALGDGQDRHNRQQSLVG